ncbi:MAG: GAF domain-containing SpoIIE family protein phosphatase [Candidatus Eisenbacteria bacterium]
MNWTIVGASLYLACGSAVLLFGIVILREAPGERLRRVAAAMMFFGGFGPLIGGLGMLLEERGGAAFLATDLATTFAYVWELFFPSLLLFALVFPREHPFLARHRQLPWLLYFPYAFHLAFLLSLARIGPSLAAFDPSAPFGLGGSLGEFLRLAIGLGALALRLLARFHIRFFSFVDLIAVTLAILLLARSLGESRAPKIRRQLRPVLFGLGSCVGLYALAVPLPNLLSVTLPHSARMILLTGALLVGTGAIGFAIVRTSFLDVGTVFRRAILFSATFGTLVTGFVLLARQMDRVLTAQVGTEIPFFQVLFVLLAVVFFHPILGRIEGAADRVLAGERVAHRGMLRDLGREITAAFDLSSISTKTVRSLRDILAVDAVRLFLRDRSGERFTDRGSSGGDPFDLEAGHPVARAVSGLLDPVAARDLAEEPASAEEREEMRVALRRLQAEIVVPVHLPEGEEALGFLTLGPKITGARFNAEDVGLLSMLATQLGFAARNARLHEEAVERRLVDEEIALARSVQESIVPRRSPRLDGIDVAAVNVPSRQVGGDYYDLIPMEQGELGIAIGDVSGKGIPAALLMSMLHAALHVQMSRAARAADLIERLNRVLCRSTAVEQFATFFFGVYRREDGTIRFCNAGHNSPFVLRADGGTESLSEGGLVLGFMEEAPYGEGAVRVAEGDLVVFYTDGVTEEAREEEEYGEGRLIETVSRCRTRQAGEIVEAVLEDVARFAGRDRYADDFTLIVLRRGGWGSAG